jgi:hypothetical protein
MTQQTLYGIGRSKTPKKFKFVLSTKDDGAKTLEFAPDGWKDSELTFIRDKMYKGVIESYSTNELTFVKDGRDFVQAAYERGGIDYEIAISIYILNNATFSYQLYFSGKLDLSTYKIDSIGVTCEIIPSGFQNTVLNRDEIDVDMMSTKFIGGGENSMGYLSGVWEKVTVPEYSATQNADWLVNDQLLNMNADEFRYILCPATNIFNEYEESTVFNQTTTVLDSIVTTGKIIRFGTEITLTVKIDSRIRMIAQNGNTNSNFSLRLILLKNGVLFESILSDTRTDVDNTTEFVFDFTREYTFSANDELSLLAYSYGENIFAMQFYQGGISFYKQLQETLPAIAVPMYYIYEAFVRTIELISGKSIPFYSDLLGRTDSVPESYASDGDASLIAITNGRWIREFSPLTNQLNFNQ